MHAFSQSSFPQGINYQAIARTNNGNPITNKTISVQFRIWIKNATTWSYSETHSGVITNNYGLFTLVIGQGNPTGFFDTINWSKSPRELQIGIDTTNGNNYYYLPKVEFWSVPYALHARVADSIAGGVSVTGGWGLTGNSGTNPSINYIGTKDSTDIVFRTNDNLKMIIKANGNIGLGSPNPLSHKFLVNNNNNIGNAIHATNNNAQSTLFSVNNGIGYAGTFSTQSNSSSLGAIIAISSGNNANVINVQATGNKSKGIMIENIGQPSVFSDTAYGVYSKANSFSPVAGNYIAGYFSARNGSKNFAGFFDDGDVFIKNKLGIGTSVPNSNSLLDIQTVNTGFGKGVLLPRVSTTQLPASTSLNVNDIGLLFYNTTDSLFNYWDGKVWRKIATQSSSSSSNIWSKQGTTNSVYVTNATDNVSIGTTTPAVGNKLEVKGNVRIYGDTTTSSYVTTIENTNPPNGISGGVLKLVNSGGRTSNHYAMLIKNSTNIPSASKTGLLIQSDNASFSQNSQGIRIETSDGSATNWGMSIVTNSSNPLAENRGMHIVSSGSAQNNYGIHITTQNATNNNWAGYFEKGNVFIRDKVRIGSSGSGVNPAPFSSNSDLEQITAFGSYGYLQYNPSSNIQLATRIHNFGNGNVASIGSVTSNTPFSLFSSGTEVLQVHSAGRMVVNPSSPAVPKNTLLVNGNVAIKVNIINALDPTPRVIDENEGTIVEITGVQGTDVFLPNINNMEVGAVLIIRYTDTTSTYVTIKPHFSNVGILIYDGSLGVPFVQIGNGVSIEPILRLFKGSNNNWYNF